MHPGALEKSDLANGKALRGRKTGPCNWLMNKTKWVSTAARETEARHQEEVPENEGALTWEGMTGKMHTFLPCRTLQIGHTPTRWCAVWVTVLGDVCVRGQDEIILKVLPSSK